MILLLSRQRDEYVILLYFRYKTICVLYFFPRGRIKRKKNLLWNYRSIYKSRSFTKVKTARGFLSSVVSPLHFTHINFFF